MKYYGLDIECSDPLLNTAGTSCVFGQGEILCVGLYNAQTEKSRAFNGNGGKAIKDLLLDPDVTLVGANIQYDIYWLLHSHKLMAKEIKCGLIDISIVESFIDEYQLKSLDALAKKYLNIGKQSNILPQLYAERGLKGDFRKHLKVLWDAGYTNEIKEYVLSDADQPCRIWEEQKKRIPEESMESLSVNLKLIKIVLGMKQRGVRIDMDKRKKNYKLLKAIQDELLASFKEKYGKVNINSTKQLAELFDRERIPYRCKIWIKGLIGETYWEVGNYAGETYDNEPYEVKSEPYFFNSSDLWEQRIHLKTLFNGVKVQKGQLVLYVPKQYAYRTNDDLNRLGYITVINPSIDKHALDKLKKEYEVAKEIVELKQVTSILDKFLGPKFDRFIVKHGEDNYRIHADYNIAGARTLRLSCIGAGTKVVTINRGCVPIENINSGDLIITHTGKIAAVKNLLIQGVKATVKVVGDKGQSVICTNDHQFFTPDGWKSLDKIKEFSYVDLEEFCKRQREMHYGNSSIFSERQAISAGNSGSLSHSISQCDVCYKARLASRTKKGRDGVEMFKSEAKNERYERKKIKQTSRLERNCFRQQGSFNDQAGQWKKNLCTPNNICGCSGNTCGKNTEKVCGTSYRRQRGKQCYRESCFMLEQITSQTAPKVGIVKKSSPMGEIPVYDLEIDHEDHSFILEGGWLAHNCHTPNLQQIPSKTVLFRGTEKEIKLYTLCRETLIPDVGMYWGKADYSGQENRLMAHFAVGKGADEIRAKYNENPDFDEHQWVSDEAHVLLRVELSRSDAKRVKFALGYGQQIRGLCETNDSSIEEGTKLYKAYNETVPFVQATMDKVSEVIVKRGYIKTLAGRHCHLQSYNGRVDIRSAYKGFNKLIQGSAADMTKKAMVMLDEAGLLDIFPLYLTVHDELDFGIPKSKIALEKLPKLQEIMEHTYLLSVPIRVDPEIGSDWGHVKGRREKKNKEDGHVIAVESMKHFIERHYRKVA